MIGSSQSSHCIGSKEELNSSGKYEIRVKVDDSVLTVSIAVTGRNSLWLEHQASQDFKVTFKSFFFFSHSHNPINWSVAVFCKSCFTLFINIHPFLFIKGKKPDTKKK